MVWRFMYWLVCVETGLLFGVLMWLGFHPFSPLRVIIYGGLAIGVAIFGCLLSDRWNSVRWTE